MDRKKVIQFAIHTEGKDEKKMPAPKKRCECNHLRSSHSNKQPKDKPIYFGCLFPNCKCKKFKES